MTLKPIYIYEGENGLIQTTVKLPLQEKRQMKRLIADEGKELVNGDVTSTCIDVELENIESWIERDKVDEQEPIN